MRNLIRCATLALLPFFMIAEANAQSVERLQSDLDSLFHDPKLASASIGVCVQSLKSGEYLYRLNEKKSLLPASNMKLFTAAEALALLAPEFRYKTNLFKDVTYGGIVIRASGDPSFGSDSTLPDPLHVFADSISSQRIRPTELRLDDEFFTSDKHALGWSVEDLPYYYAPEVGALSYRGDQTNVKVWPSKNITANSLQSLDWPGKEIKVTNETETLHDSIRCVNPTCDSQLTIPWSTINISRSLCDNDIFVSGDISWSHDTVEQSLSIHDPGLSALNVFRQYLGKRRIVVKDILRGYTEYEHAPLIATWISQTLSTMIRAMNKESDNLYAECLFRTIAKEKGGEGSWTRGIEVMRKYLASIGIDTIPLQFTDGSGLSRMDFVTTDAIVHLLGAMWNDTKLKEPFYNSLPIAGIDGTFKNHLKGTPAEGNARGKSGSMTGVRALSGYLTTKDGEPLAYSIILNNYTTAGSDVGKLEDSAVLRLVNFSRK